MKKYFLLLTLFISTISYAQKNMYTEMPYGQNINCAYADGNYIWFGTDFGLVKYNRLTGDKINYTYFDITGQNETLGESYAQYAIPSKITAITKDKSGNLYFVMSNVVYKYDGFVWSVLYDEYNVPILSLQYSNDNKIWIVSANSGTFDQFYYDVNTQQLGNPTIPIVTGAIDKYGFTWAFDTDNSQIIEQDSAGNTVGSYPINSSLDTIITGAYIDSKDIFWYTTYNQGIEYLYKLDNGVTTSYTIPNFNVGNSQNIMQLDSNGNLYILYTLTLTYYNGTILLPVSPPDRIPLVKFDGTSFTLYDSTQIGSSYYNFSCMTIDAGNNLWLGTGYRNNKAIQKDIFEETSTGSWYSFYLNNFYLPGSYFYGEFYLPGSYLYGANTDLYPFSNNYLGSDSVGNAYFNFDNSIATVDTNYSVSITQFEDSVYKSLLNGVSSFMTEGAAVNKNGAVWVAFTNTFNLSQEIVKVYGEKSIVYSNLPFNSTTVVQSLLAVPDNSVYFVATDQKAGTSIAYHFDGTTYTALPTTGYPRQLDVGDILGYDEVHNYLWYIASDTLGIYIIKYDGNNNTLFPYNNLFANLNKGNFFIDKNGNIWFIGTDTSNNNINVLYNWNPDVGSFISYPPDAPYQITLPNFYSYFPIYSQNDGVFYMLGTLFPTGTPYVLKFDGIKWKYFALDESFSNAMFDLQWVNAANVAFFKSGSNLCFSFPNDMLIYNPNGIPNPYILTYNDITGNIFYDMNRDSVFDAGDIEAGMITIKATGNDNYNTLSNWDGSYAIQTDTGKQMVSVTLPPYFKSVPINATHDFHDSTGLGATQNFALQPIPGINDLAVYGGYYGFVPGYNSAYYLDYKNKGTTSLNATLTLTFDNNLSFVQAYPTPTSVSGNVVTWNLDTLHPFDEGYAAVELAVPSTDTIGWQLNSVAQINPIVNDTTPADNTFIFSNQVSSSFDPNAKTVTPTGSGNAGIVDTTQVLTYTVSFQNTGNDTAFNIIVADTISANIDITSFHLISSSAPVKFYFQQPNVIEFVFSNINLPDSNRSQPASHGFVTYSVKPKSGSNYGSTINNTGYIYFDYNPAVVTNTVTNTLGNPLSVEEISNNQNISIKLYPNPTDGIVGLYIDDKNYTNYIVEITDVSGRVLLQETTKLNRSSYNLSDFSAGVYFLCVRNESGLIGTGKIVLVK